MAAALRVLDGVGLSADSLAVEPAWIGTDPAGSRARSHAASFTEEDRALVAAADALLLAVDPSGPRLERLLAPAPAPGFARDLAWLLRPLRLTIRFEPCRGEVGDVVLFGDGGFDPPDAEARTALLEAAFHYARKHGRRRVGLAVAPAEGAREARSLVDVARRVASGVPGVDLEEADVEELRARASRGGGPRDLDILVAPGGAWARLEPLLADAVGGAPVVPRARFGEESALLEAGCAGSRAAAPPRPERACPIAAIRAAALLCEWLGETGKGARVAAATDALLREGLPAAPAASESAPGAPGAPDDALADWTMDIAVAIVRKF